MNSSFCFFENIASFNFGGEDILPGTAGFEYDYKFHSGRIPIYMYSDPYTDLPLYCVGVEFKSKDFFFLKTKTSFVLLCTKGIKKLWFIYSLCLQHNHSPCFYIRQLTS